MDKVLVLEYENLLLGNSTSISSLTTAAAGYQVGRIATDILRYCIEDILQWTPQEMLKRFNSEVVERMKLQDVVQNIAIPPELDSTRDYYYYAHLLYPDQINYNFQESVINLYRRILANQAEPIKSNDIEDVKVLKRCLEKDPSYRKIKEEGRALYKFPKDYMDENKGISRACICLRYALANLYEVKSIPDLYFVFSNTIRANRILRSFRLQTIARDLFDSPLDYLHKALPQSQQNDVLYSYYHYLNLAEPEYIQELQNKTKKAAKKNKKKGE